MKAKLKPCPFCGSKAQPLYEEQIEITCSNIKCRMYPASFAVHIQQWQSRPIEDALQARITELEKQVVVWHNYPEEKPEPSYEYEVNIPVIIYSMNGCTYFADYNIDSGNFWRYGGKENNVSHWAYLPEPPREEGND